MERQKKPWKEMTEEERQEIRESWKHTLPENFDVFFVGEDFIDQMLNLVVPGNVYATVNLDVGHISIDGDLIVDGSINCGNVTVTENFIVKGEVDCLEVNIGDLFDCYDVDSWDFPVNASDYVCRRYEEESNKLQERLERNVQASCLFSGRPRVHTPTIFTSNYIHSCKLC